MCPCVCDILDHNTETWWNWDDETITQYPGYLSNVYDDLSIDKIIIKRIRNVYGCIR